LQDRERRLAVLRSSVVRAGTRLIGLMPDWIMRSIAKLWLRALSNRTPREALKALLEWDTYLDRFIDAAAMRYGDGVHPKHRLTRYHDFFVERIHSGEGVLDVGCGIGALAYSIATRAQAKVVGIDIDEGCIREAKARFVHPDLEFRVGDATSDLPQASFDVVVMSNVLEHIEHRIDFLLATKKSLGPCRWLFRVPMIDRHWTVPLREELGLFPYSDNSHFIEYTEESFRSELQAAGLAVTEVKICWGEIWAEAVTS
jgi:SAM-dependent methyltransferase